MTKGVVDLIRMTEAVRATVVQNKKRARYEERYSAMEQFIKEEGVLDAALILIKTLDRKNRYTSAFSQQTSQQDTNGHTTETTRTASKS